MNLPATAPPTTRATLSREAAAGTDFKLARGLWVAFVASLSISGMGINIGGQKVLPEHLMLAVLVIYLVFTPRPTGQSGKARPVMLVAFISVTAWFASSALVSIVVPPDPGQSIRLLAWMATNLVAFVCVYLVRLPTAVMVSDAIVTCCVLAGCYSLAWVGATISGARSNFVSLDYASSNFRAQGLMLEPNLLASFFVLAGAVAFVYRRHLSPALIVCSLSLFGVIIALTFTRVAWLIFAVLVIAFYVAQTKNRLRTTGIVLSVSVAAMIILTTGLVPLDNALGSTFQNRLENLFQFDGGTGRFRLQSADLAIADILRSGFPGGHGFNAFPQHYESGITSDGRLYLGILWLVIFYDGGFIAAFFFLTAFFSVWWAAPRGAWIFFLGFAVAASTTNPLWYAFPWAFAALLARPPSGMKTFDGQLDVTVSEKARQS